jgi:hypothetical protein
MKFTPDPSPKERGKNLPQRHKVIFKNHNSPSPECGRHADSCLGRLFYSRYLFLLIFLMTLWTFGVVIVQIPKG